MEDQEQTSLRETQSQKPILLKVICILTLIGSGMNFFSCFIIFLFFDTFKIVATNLAKSLNLPGMDMLINGPSLFFFTSALIYVGSIIGALMMWHLKKVGFHIYTISQILLVIAPMYFFKLSGPGVMDIILAGVFVLLYSMNLKSMS